MKILRIIIDPILNGKSLSDFCGINVIELHNSVLTEWFSISGESMEVIKTEYSTELPIKEDRYQYTSDEYLSVLVNSTHAHNPDILNYDSLIKKFDLINRKNNGEFDEVHFYSGSYIGFYESRMIGRNSIWCNAPAFNAECDNFIIMGFNFTRSISEAIEAFGHRTESTLKYCYVNFFADFTKYVGTIHTPHNAINDYDWNNSDIVNCYADKYPDAYNQSKGCSALLSTFFKTKSIYRPVPRNADYWNNNSLDYFRYWYNHIPKSMWNVILNVNKIKKFE
jgi:hypothetical protein